MPLERGHTLGHSVIQGLLGEGGMGRVYEAQDSRLKRRVALKVLPDNVAHDESRRSQFEREPQAAAALNHPNIVTLRSFEPVYIFRKVSGQHFDRYRTRGRCRLQVEGQKTSFLVKWVP